jgi:hypothetical protein
MNKQKGIVHLLQDVFATKDHEIHCDQTTILMARSIHEQLSEDEGRRQYPELWHHFHFCPNCAQEYQMLGELVRLEANQQLVHPWHIPLPPDEGKPARWGFPNNVIQTLFPGFSFALATDARLVRQEREVVEVSLAQSSVLIEFDVASHGDEAQLYDLFCYVSVTDEALCDYVDGALVWVQLGDDGPAIQEKALDELGEVTFARLPAGKYALRLQLAGQTYAVTGIILS